MATAILTHAILTCGALAVVAAFASPFVMLVALALAALKREG